jgi:hypothetical protein
MLGPGDPVPHARVWPSTTESADLAELVGGRPALLVFYLFDWSAT